MLMLKIGDKIRDNDPRIQAIYNRVLTIAEVLPDKVIATEGGRSFKILRRRIHTDGKPRKGGFDLVQS